MSTHRPVVSPAVVLGDEPTTRRDVETELADILSPGPFCAVFMRRRRRLFVLLAQLCIVQVQPVNTQNEAVHFNPSGCDVGDCGSNVCPLLVKKKISNWWWEAVE